MVTPTSGGGGVRRDGSLHLSARYQSREDLATLGNKPFCWGDNTFPSGTFPLAWSVSAGLMTVTFIYAPTSAPAIDQGMSLQAVRGTVLVTAAQLFVFYNTLGGQTYVKMLFGNRGVRASSLCHTSVLHAHRSLSIYLRLLSLVQVRAETVATRSMMNTMEQMVPFLTLLWLCTAYVDAAYAASLGAVYVATRALYPLAYAYYGQFTALCELVTQPNYNVIANLFAGLVLAAAADASWHDLIIYATDSSPVLLFPCFFATNVAFLLAWAPIVRQLGQRVVAHGSQRRVGRRATAHGVTVVAIVVVTVGEAVGVTLMERAMRQSA